MFRTDERKSQPEGATSGTIFPSDSRQHNAVGTVFAGLTHWKVIFEGRNLRPLYDRIQDHCPRWIRSVHRDFAGENGKPVVTAIQVEDVTPKEPG